MNLSAVSIPNAVGPAAKGCSVEWDDTPENQILPGQCTRENGYPFFLPQK